MTEGHTATVLLCVALMLLSIGALIRVLASGGVRFRVSPPAPRQLALLVALLGYPAVRYANDVVGYATGTPSSDHVALVILKAVAVTGLLVLIVASLIRARRVRKAHAA